MRRFFTKCGLRRALAGFAALLTVLCCLIELPARAAEEPSRSPLSTAYYSAGRRKTTPTPKPKKTPKPETAAPAETPAPETPAPEEEKAPAVTPTPVPDGPIIEPQAIADWLFAHDMTLPDNFITKKEAQALGWGTRYRYVSQAAPGKSIGGDYFGNYESLLPTAKGRKYYECDCYYVKGKRSEYRVIFSNDGLVFYTEDHYQTFVQLFPSDTQGDQGP